MVFSDTVKDFQDIMKYYQSNGYSVHFRDANQVVVYSSNVDIKYGGSKIIYSGQSLSDALASIDLDMSVKAEGN